MVPESSRDLMKTQIISPSLEFLIQYLKGGGQELSSKLLNDIPLKQNALWMNRRENCCHQEAVWNQPLPFTPVTCPYLQWVVQFLIPPMTPNLNYPPRFKEDRHRAGWETWRCHCTFQLGMEVQSQAGFVCYRAIWPFC